MDGCLFQQDIRREEINKKLEEAEKKEKEELSSQRKELFTERRAKQAELRLLQRKVDMAELVNKNCSDQSLYCIVVFAVKLLLLGPLLSLVSKIRLVCIKNRLFSCDIIRY